MMPNITRGGRAAGLMTYLVGEGRANELENPHVVAGHDVMLQAAPEGALTTDDALDLANLLDQPRKVFGTSVMVPVREWNEEQQAHVKVGEKEGHMWHASLSLNPGEGPLSDRQWQNIANDFVGQMGFVDPDGAKSCRWVAIGHGASKNGNDHIHIAVNLVREDGTKQPVHNDHPRSQKIVNGLEKKYGLQVLESREKEQQQDAALPVVVTPGKLHELVVRFRPRWWWLLTWRGYAAAAFTGAGAYLAVLNLLPLAGVPRDAASLVGLAVDWAIIIPALALNSRFRASIIEPGSRRSKAFFTQSGLLLAGAVLGVIATRIGEILFPS